MSNLPALDSYRADELAEAHRFSPALKHYSGSSSPRNAAWSRCALATILNKSPTADVCVFWSDFAHRTLREAFEREFPQQKISLWALGKLGSDELNLSSDVDLMMVSSEDSAESLKGLRRFQKSLSERTAQGFVFRVDFDLRPGGRHGPLIPTLDQFVDYYGNYGETWERLAFVRLKPLAGSSEVITPIQAFAKKFTYRKHLDYTLLDDLKLLRSQIRQHYSPRSSDSVWDLKLGVGAIRDIELFTHALQVIHGGKNPQLQVSSTARALEMLQQNGLLMADDAHFLVTHYWQLRQLENFVQAVNDEQTHLLDRSHEAPAWAQALMKTLDENLERCDRVVSTLLGHAPVAQTTMPATHELSEDAQKTWQEILQIEVLSRHKDRDEQARRLFLQQFHETLLRQKGDADKAFQHLKDFVRSTRAKASLFTLLNRHKNLLEELAWLFGHSPYLSQILSSRPELMDSYVYRSQDLQLDDLGFLLEQLVEKRLLGELIAGSHYLEDRNVLSLQENLSSTADTICQVLLTELKKEFPSDLDILCLGKWGGRELGFRSDLDFILVTPDEPGEADSKIARRFINRLTELRKGGNIYPIDMRLRPSGKAGPFVISKAQLQTYLRDEAEVWERQAYLKARHLNSSPLVLELGSKTLTPQDLQALEKIRRDLIRRPATGWDLKYTEGGLLDIELCSQTLFLQKGAPKTGISTIYMLAAAGPETAILQKNYVRMRQIEQMQQLVSTEGGAKVEPNNESFQHLAKALQTTSEELQKELSFVIAENLQHLNRLDPRRISTILA